MDQLLAMQVLTEALNAAMKSGCFGLVESTNIVKALETISILAQPQEITNEIEIKKENE